VTFSIGGGPKRPSRPPTHKALDTTRLARHARDLDEIAEDGQITAEAIDDLAFERGVDIQELYAALATSELELRREHEVRFEVCAGGCQEWGGLEMLGHLLEVRAERIDDDATAWDVVPRPCLDQCRHAAAVIAAGPAGHALIPEATIEKLDEAIAELVDGGE
jgi:hypothetical protein